MRKIALCLSAIAIAFATLGVRLVQAQSGSPNSKMPGTWGSSINIQNTDSTAADSVIISFYDSNGTNVLNFTAATASNSIPAGGSRSYYVPSQIPGLSSGQYAVSVASNKQLLIIANAGSETSYSSANPMSLTSYAGVSNPGTTLNYPGLYKSYFGFTSEIVLQNTEATAASNVVITFYNQKTGAQVAQLTSPATNIPANSTRAFAMDDFAGIPSGNANGLLAAVVTSDRNLAGIANIWSTASPGQTSSYNAARDGAVLFYAPALYKNYFNFNSALTIQNVDSSAADIKVTYSNGTIKTTTLQPRQSIEYYQPSDVALPSGNSSGVFSAKVESTNGKKIVGLVSVNDNKTFDSYNTISDFGTLGVNCPVTLQSFFGYFSAETVQNLGSVATVVTATYAGGQTRQSPSIPPNGTYNFLELKSSGTVLPDGSSVSVVFTSSNGQPLAAVTQQNYIIPKAGDSLSSYACIKK